MVNMGKQTYHNNIHRLQPHLAVSYFNFREYDYYTQCIGGAYGEEYSPSVGV